MPSYLTQVWAARTQLSGVQRFQVGGMEAATGSTRLQTNSGIADVRLVAIRGDSETLASRMAVDSYQLETFRVLNGLAASERSTTGVPVKIVTE
jgi:predicted Zn-dependent protease